MSERAAVGIPIKIGFVLLVAGIVTAMVIDDWRWLVFGALALLLAAVLGARPTTTRKP